MDTTLDPLPLGWPIDHATPQPAEPMEDLRGVVEHALAHPLSSLPLADLAGPGTRVTVVIAIAGREHDAANAAMVPALLRELEQAGVADDDITLLIPNALHHPSTMAEKRHSLGRAITERYKFVDHDPTNQAELNDLGTFQGAPVQVSYHAAEADLLIAIDVVEPHYYAGYSGGNKTISIGCVGAATLNEARTVRFLDDLVAHPADTPDSMAMMLEREIGRRAGLMFVLNAVVDLEGRTVAVSAGAPNAVHDVLIRFARRFYEVDVPRNDYDIIIAGNGHAKKHTLYHASSAAVALGLAPARVLARGGVIILPVFCGGEGRMDKREQQFYEALSRANDMDTVMQQLAQRGVRSGEQRAYMLAQVMQAQRYSVIVVGADCADLARDCGLISANSMLEAASLAETIVGRRPHVLMLPHATRLMPINRWRSANTATSSKSIDDDNMYVRSIVSDN